MTKSNVHRKSLGLFKDADFRKSSFSPVNYPPLNYCVEVAHKDGILAVRNSQDPKKGTVFFNEGEWGAFIQGVKNGEFDI